MFAAIGPGRYSATSAATSSNVVGASERISARIGPPSSWNTPIESARRSNSKVGSSSSGTVVDVEVDAARVADDLDGVGEHVEVAQAEEVHLQQAEVFDAVHLVLRHDRRFLGILARVGLALDRQVLGERVLGDHHRGGVDAVLAAQAFEALGDVDDPLAVGVGLVHGPQVAGHLVAVLVARRSGRGTPSAACRGP